MPHETTTTTTHGEQSLDAVLRPIHRAWIDEARRYLVPVLEPEADFWARWTAVRYLADDFREHYRYTRSLIDNLSRFLEPEQAARLQRSGDRLLRLRLEVDRIGRRRGTAVEAARATHDLLTRLELWCVEIETSTTSVTANQLPEQAADLLAHLEATLARPAMSLAVAPSLEPSSPGSGRPIQHSR